MKMIRVLPIALFTAWSLGNLAGLRRLPVLVHRSTHTFFWRSRILKRAKRSSNGSRGQRLYCWVDSVALGEVIRYHGAIGPKPE
jgi:hypothetical protein